jgi:hypothetical protein
MRTILFCLLTVACSSSSDHTKSCNDLAAARCAKLMSCSSFDFQRRYASMTECQTRHSQSCVNSFAAPQNSNSDTRTEACAADLANQNCTDFLANVTSTACLPNMGPRANGQPCAFSGQCTSTYCAVPEGADCGTCADVPKAGDSCALTADCGGRGLVCSNAACVQPLAMGAACTRTGDPCGQGLVCVVPPMMMGNGTCQTEATMAGAACDAARRMAPDCSRDAGLYCTMQGTCATITLAGASGQCGTTTTGALCSDGACFGATATAAGACKANVADGMPCDTVNGPECTAPARCVGSAEDGGSMGTCQMPGMQSCG